MAEPKSFTNNQQKQTVWKINFMEKTLPTTHQVGYVTIIKNKKKRVGEVTSNSDSSFHRDKFRSCDLEGKSKTTIRQLFIKFMKMLHA